MREGEAHVLKWDGIMFCPTRKGFFPLLYHKLTESLSREELASFSSLTSNEERLSFLWRLPRLSSEFEDNLFRLVKPMHGDKVSKKVLRFWPKCIGSAIDMFPVQGDYSCW